MRRNRNIRETRDFLLKRKLARQERMKNNPEYNSVFVPAEITPQMTVEQLSQTAPALPVAVKQSRQSIPITTNPKFTILMALYNCEPFIDEAINSVLRQTYTNWELLICDDISTDGSYPKALSYAEKDERIKVHKNDVRMHCSSTYAKLLSLATGDISAVVDADDSLAMEAMDWVARAYEKYPGIDWIYTQFFFCTSDLKPIKQGFCRIPRTNLLDEEDKGKHCYSHWRTFKTKLRDYVLFPLGIKSSVDKALGYRLEEVASGGCFGLPLYFYRQRGHSISSKKDTNGYKSVSSAAKERRRVGNIKPIKIQNIIL